MQWRAPWLKSRLTLAALALWDVMAMGVSYETIYAMRVEEPNRSWGIYAAILVWVSSSYLLGRYSPIESREAKTRCRLLSGLTGSATAVLAVFVAHAWLYQATEAATRLRGFLLPVIVCAAVISAGGEVVCESAINSRRRRISWLFFCSESEKKVLTRITGMNRGDLRFADDHGEEERYSQLGVRDESERVVVGAFEGLRESQLSQVLARRESGQRVCSLVNWCELELERVPPEFVSKQWLLNADGFSMRPGGLGWRIKRSADIVVAIFLLVLTCPVIAAAAVAIYLEDRGPILYRQERTGLFGTKIIICKLRSMIVKAESDGIRWAKANDSRVTNVGKIIRATRIDEVPQLINVVKGEMSLIGPRPERPIIEEDLEKQIPFYRIRHWIRPGLSGWAQVSCPYGASVEDSKLKLSYDIFYLRNAGPLLDILILIKTIRLVMFARGSKPRDH